jgi:GTPase
MCPMNKSGFVTIAGQPNVGKSTLINSFLGEKVAIISRRAETTRDNIRGILTEKDSQIIFIDTPGIHKPHNLLGKVMLTRAHSSILEADIILFLTEKRLAFNKDDMRIIDRFPKPEEGKTVFLIVNKCDRLKQKSSLLPIIAKAQKIYPFDEIVPISALDKKHTNKLIDTIKKYIPEGPVWYPEDQLTDKGVDFDIREIIREKLLTETYHEIPHSAAVVIEEMIEENEGKKLRINAIIYLERQSQKSIVIGKGGLKLKKVGELARKEIEKLVEKKVYLDLWVKISEKWKQKPGALNEMGYID